MPQLVHELLELPGGHPPAPRAAGQHDRRGRRRDPRPQRPPQHLGHPRVALDDRGRLVVGAAHGHRADQLADRGLGDVELAERGQDVADVGEEGAVRPDHDHPAPPDLLPVRVQQVGDPVQADGGLPGAGRALHTYRLVGAGPDDIVLVGLDGRDDVPHGSGPRPLDLLDQDPARPGPLFLARTGLVIRPGREQLVLVGGQLAAGEPEAPPQREVHRVGGAGPVERPGHRRPPVDHRGRAVRRVHVPAADVEAVPGDVVVGHYGSGYFSSGISRYGLSGSGLSGSGLSGSGLSGSGLSGSGLSGSGLSGVVETAEEERGVRDVLQGLGPVVQVGLEVFLGDGVSAHGAQRQYVFAHQPEELAGALQLLALGRQDGVTASPFGLMLVLFSRCW